MTRRLPLKVPVAPTFSGLRIADTERVPEPLRGRVIPWMQVRWLREYEANFTDETGDDVIHHGRRVTGSFDSKRQAKVTWKLLEREIRRRFETAILNVEYAWQPKPTNRWVSVVGVVWCTTLFATLAVAGTIKLVEFFESIVLYEPTVVRVIFIVLGTFLAIVPPIMAVLLVIAARISSQRSTVRVLASATGVSATRGDGSEVNCLWKDLESIEYPYLKFRNQAPLRSVADARFRALLSVLRDDLCLPAPPLKRFGIMTATASLFGGGFVVMTLVTLERHGYLEPGETLRMLKIVGLGIAGLLAYFGLILFIEQRSSRPRSRRRRSPSLPASH